MNNITKNPLKLIKNLFALLLVLTSFHVSASPKYKGEMLNQKQNRITLRFALSKEEHTKGLSGLKTNQFNFKEGMLFVNSEESQRIFWMPDTYFNLDIMFLDTNLKVVGIEKNVMAHPGMIEPPIIQKTNAYIAKYILETKSGSAFSKDIKQGDQLKFKGSTSLEEIVLNTRLLR
jgi:uncharacterized membrane protein (UPF0127 family)